MLQGINCLIPSSKYNSNIAFRGKITPSQNQFNKSKKILQSGIAIGSALLLSKIDKTVNDGEEKELSNKEVNDLILYFNNIKRNNASSKSYLTKNNDNYTVVVKDENDNILEENKIEEKNNYGMDYHVTGNVYRNIDMTDQEKALDNEVYLKHQRIKYYNSQNGDINKINFNIPEVKDRPLKIAFVAFDPRGEDKVSFSVGVNYLESALKQQFEEKVDILMLDDQLQSVDDIKKQLEAYQPDFIGVASKIHTYHKSSPFLDYCKKEFPNALTAIGGTTATYAFKEILKEHPGVVAIAGNGEKAVCGIAEILLGEKSKKDIFYVPNLVLKQNDGQLIMSRQLTDDLDIKPTETNLKEILQKNGMTYLRLSQGCWGHCTFCSQPEKWESARIDEVIDTLKEWEEKYNLKYVSFSDDEMVPKDHKAALDRLDYFTKKMIEKNVNVRWFMNLRADSIHFLDSEKGEQIIKQLKESNCAGFFLGIESGSDEQLKRYAKQVAPNKTDVEVNERIINKLRESGIPIAAGFIMFDPLMPTMSELRDNLSFFDKNNLMGLQSRLNNNMRVEKGTNYIQMVANMGLDLIGGLQPNLLTYDSKYLDPRVGTIKDHIDIFIEEIRPQYELIYNANYLIKMKPNDELQKQLEKIDKDVKLITRNYLEEMINLFPESEEDKMIDEQGVKSFSKDFWQKRMENLTNEVNSKIPELYQCREKYREQLNKAVAPVEDIITKLT